MVTETLVSTTANGTAVHSGPLNQADVDFYHENGFLRIPAVFTPAESHAQADDLDRLAREWATVDKRWSGPWRKVYMDEESEKKASLEAMHELHFYSQPWLAAVSNPKLVACLVQLLGPDIELHHSVMHNKPPGGQPFPMHQDHPFYRHDDGRYLDVLIHLDDTCHDNGAHSRHRGAAVGTAPPRPVRFLPGSHQQGPLEHILGTEEQPSAPHLPTDRYRLVDSVAVGPAEANGSAPSERCRPVYSNSRCDVVVFSYYTVHGSYINSTDRTRRMVRRRSDSDRHVAAQVRQSVPRQQCSANARRSESMTCPRRTLQSEATPGSRRFRRGSR